MRDIFNALDIAVEEVSMSQAEAIEKVKNGEIAATALIAGKPELGPPPTACISCPYRSPSPSLAITSPRP